MTGNKTYNIASAIVAVLNIQFAGQFLAVLESVPLADLDSLGDDLRVVVVPGDVTDERISRQQWMEEHTVSIGVQKKIGRETETETAAVVAMADSIKKYLRDMPLSAAGASAPSKAKHGPIVSPEHFRQFRVVSSIVTVTYSA